MGKGPYFLHVSTVVSGDHEWDESKAEANLAKHGVGFDEAPPRSTAIRTNSPRQTQLICLARTRSSCPFELVSFSS
jgi:hypothetical protein